MKGFKRPPMSVLPDSALIPDRGHVVPAPNQFTHEVVEARPYYFAEPSRGATADGELPAGTKVVLMVHHSGPWCRVIDGRGLYVVTAFAGLRKL